MHSARKCPPFPVRGRNAPKRTGQTMEYTVWSVAADRPAMIIPLLYHNFSEFQPFFWDLKIFNFLVTVPGPPSRLRSRSDISENKSDLPSLTKRPSAKSKVAPKPSVYAAPRKYPCCGGPIFGGKTALHTGSARGAKKRFSFTAFFWVFLLDNRKTHAMMVSES